uniref:WGS project CBMG000000000 data, contig CS5907-c003533 n=1 Tax=Fusarium acuminatum CS5907 TaxID=1318461 RepID=A0A090MA27_9HYPO|nr:unnamed protein product [Fusarium acuminatum CS5907]
MEWQEEGEISEGTLGQNRVRKQTAPKSSGGVVEAVQSLKQVLEQDFNKKIEAMKAEFQREFTKLRARMAEEVARATAQIAQELSPVRDQLTQAYVTRDGRNANRLRVIGRNEEEMQKIKTILETRKAPGTKVLQDQLYPIKVNSMNRMAVFDQKFNILPGALKTLSHKNEIQIVKAAWLSRKVNLKSYRSMVVYLTKSNNAKKLLQEHYFLIAGESAYTSVFE